jgi:hypothetical protein
MYEIIGRTVRPYPTGKKMDDADVLTDGIFERFRYLIEHVDDVVPPKPIGSTAKRMRLASGGKNDDVATPVVLLNELDREFHFDDDPCPLRCAAQDGLTRPWGRSNFINPPFSRCTEFLEKGVAEARSGKTCVFLIVARTNSNYWNDYVFPWATDVRVVTRRLTFAGYDNKLTHSIAIVVYRGLTPETTPRRHVRSRPGYEYVPLHLDDGGDEPTLTTRKTRAGCKKRLKGA